MSDEHIVPLSYANESDAQVLSVQVDGRPVRIDVVTGHLFDRFGNDAGRWSPMEETRIQDQNTALSRSAHRESAHQSALGIAGSCVSPHGHEYVQSVARSYQALSIANSEQRAQYLETGTYKETAAKTRIDPKAAKFLTDWRNANQTEQTQLLSAATPEQMKLLVAAASQALDVGVADVHVAQALPNFITGYHNEGPVADVYSPPLVVQHKSDYYWQYKKEDAFQRALPQLGAAGGAPSEIFPRFGNTEFTAIQRAVAAFVPTEVEANQDAPLQIKLGHENRMLDAAILEREIRTQALARTSGNWNSATTLATTYQWNGGANSDPVKDIQTIIESSYGEPNAMIIPGHIWHDMVRNPAVRSYYTYGGSTPGILTDQQMAALLRLPEIYVARMKYINTSGALKYVWGDDITVFRRPLAMPPVNQRDVCTSVTFRWAMQNIKIPDGQTFSPEMTDGRGWVMRQFFNQIRGGLGGIQMILCLADAEVQTSKYIGNLLINAHQ